MICCVPLQYAHLHYIASYDSSITCFPEYQEKIPFVKEAPIEQLETKKQKKMKEGAAKKAAVNVEQGVKDMNIS